MRIDIVSDPVCPWCFIGKRRLERALRQHGIADVEIFWRPFQLNPDMPEAGMDRDSYLSTKFRDEYQARDVYEHMRKIGAAEDIAFAFDRIGRTPNTVASHRLIRYASREDAANAVVEALFTAYFIGGADLGDLAVLADIGASAGLEREALAAYLDSDEDEADIRQDDKSARGHGIRGVPCFIIGGKYVVSGAQEPEVFGPVFDLALKDEVNADADA